MVATRSRGPQTYQGADPRSRRSLGVSTPTEEGKEESTSPPGPREIAPELVVRSSGPQVKTRAVPSSGDTAH